MPSIGGTELVIILVFAFLLFGPDKLPQMGHTIGRALRQFRQTQEKLTNVVQTEVVDPMAAAASAPKAKAAEQAAVDDEDADLDASEGAEAAPQRKETFAERRARLAAEKAEREAAAANEAGAEPAAADASDAPAAAEAPATEQADATEPAEAPASAEPEAEAEPAVQTTEDLYARRPRKHRASKVAQAEDSTDSVEGGEQ